MPYVNVKTAGKLSREQREAIAKDISESLEKNAQKAKSHTYIVFDEVERDHWAIGDELLG